MTSKPRRKSKSAPVRRRPWRWLGGILLLLLGALLVWLVYLDWVVREKFDGRKWALPARVYAQPLELYDGRLLRLADLREELRALDYRPVARVSSPGQWSLDGDAVELFVRSHRLAEKAVAARHVRFRLRAGQISGLQVLAGEHSSLVALDPALIGGIYPRRREDRDLVRLDQVPPLLGEALIAVEDRAFIHHWGVSPRAIARAAWVNLRSGRVVQGGSTLTQQLVKNFFLDQRRSLGRKLTEAAMALLLELHYSKAEILETYLNEIYLGQSGPRQIHGFGLAARHYFQRPLADLQPHEIALLVGVVKGASYYNPWRHPQRALARRNLVLDILEREQLLEPAEAQRLRALPLGVVAASERRISDYPAFIDLVKRQLREDYSDSALSSEGLKIYTTLSLSAQRHAERALARRLQLLERGYRLDEGSLQGALVVTAVGSGEVEALVGDRKPRFAGFNRALDARRPIGSLVKPAVYLAALSSGGGYHLASTLSDEPLQVRTVNGDLWQPDNFEHKSHGAVLLVDALANSYNQATARLGLELGLDQVSASLRQLGVTAEIPQVPALLLGALELSPLQVSQMYHSLANDGVVVPLRTIRAVVDADHQPLSRYPLQLRQGEDPAAVSLVQFGLQSVMRDGTGKTAYRRLPEDLALAGKTGTSNEQRDSWFAGFSGQHLAVAWVGRDDNGATPLTGASGALRVWTDLYAELPSRGLEILPPAGIDYLWVDADSGLLSDENCRAARLLPFTEAQRPRARADCERIRNPVIHWLKKWL